MKKLFLYVLLSVPIIGFGQTKISDMPAATTPTGAELVPIVQGGYNKKATIDQINSGYIKTANFYTIGDGRWLKLPALPGIGQDGQSLRWNNGTGLWEYFTASAGNLTGAITSSGLATSLGSFTSNALGTAISDPVRTVTGTDAIVQADNGRTIYFNSATPFNFTIDALTTNSSVYFYNKGSATVTFVDGSGVTSTGVTSLAAGESGGIIYESSTTPIILGTPYGGGGTVNYVTPEQYGAVGDGVTNDATAIQSAVDTGSPVYFGKNTYLVSSAIIIPANSYLFGAGEESVLKTTSNISILEIDSTNSVFQNLTFKGNDTGTLQVGISAVGNAASNLRREGNQVLNCRFYDLGGAGLYTIYSGFGSSLHKGTFYVDNCIFNSNRYGVYWNTTGEYNLITGSTITNNTSGVYMNAAGNNSIVNSNINDNTTGITMVGGLNDGHCVISGTKLNHNTTSLNLSYIDYGFLFQGCMIYGGVMVLNTDDFIKFDNCDISQTTITVTNNTSLRFFNNRFFITPTFTVTGTNPIFFNNHWDSGITPSILDNTIVGKTTFAPTSTYAGVNVGSVSADPSTLNNGELFYNTTSNELKARINGATVALGSGGGGGNVATDAIWNSAGEIVYATGANAATTLAAGTNGQVLTLSGGLPSWAASASGWGLSGISTLIGLTNIRSNAGDQLIFDGTYTQSIGAESAQKFNSTITGPATALHESIGTSVNHTITAGANSQHLIGLDVNPISFATGGFSNTVTSALRVKGKSIGSSTAALLIAGSATSSTTAIRIENSSGDFLFSMRGDGAFIHETSMAMGFFDAGFTTASPSGNHYLYQTTKIPDVNGYAMNFRSTATISSTSGQRGRFQLLGGTFSPSSGSGTLIHTTLKETINQTGTASGGIKMLSIEPTYTSALGAVTGIDYNPTVTSVSGTHLAFRSTSGNWAMQGSGTNLTLGGGATASQLRFLEPSGSGTNYTSFSAVAQSADINYSLPPTVAAAGAVLTDAAGNGVLTWEDKSLQSSTNTKTEKVIYNVGTIGSAATSTYSIHAESYYANGTTLLAKITVVAVKTDGSASAHSTVTARFRKNSSGTWSVDDAGTDITSDITILADVVGDFSTNPNVKVTMGAASGNYNVSWVAETIEVK